MIQTAALDPASVTLLQDLIRKEGRSLLQYVSEAFPWTTPKNEAAWAKIQEMVQEEQEGTGRLARVLQKHRQRLPYLGAYPMSFTNINFVSLEHLIPYLVDFEKRRIAELEVDLLALRDDDAREAVAYLLDMKRRHLEALHTLSH